MRVFLNLSLLSVPLFAAEAQQRPAVPEHIKAYCIDFNWGEGGVNGFARPGLWADADPAQHVAWYKAIGANVIQTFCNSCNGYAWYKGGPTPGQPGLEHDFLTEVVRLGHKEGMLVLGYFCAGSNPKWGQENPQLSYGYPSLPHIPYTDEYLAYFTNEIRHAVLKTGVDGFMIDWLWMPDRSATGNTWRDCEKRLYTQLMGKPFPEGAIPPEKELEYGRRALLRAWQAIRRAAKEANPDCIIMLSVSHLDNPTIADSPILQEADWVLNEAGDLQRTEKGKRMIGPKTRLITCLAAWNNQDPLEIVPDAVKAGVGLYGFCKPPSPVSSLIPLDFLDTPVEQLKGDQRNIAVLARAYRGR